MKPRLPDETGFVERDGVRVHWERFGDGDQTLALLPAWALFPSAHWKMQVPYLSRSFRVIVIEGRGRGLSDTPAGAEAYAVDEYVADIVAVLDATGTDRALLVALSRGALWAIATAAAHPSRTAGVVTIGPSAPFGDLVPRDRAVFEADTGDTEGWAKYNFNYWRRDYPDFVEFFIDQMFPERHSTKPHEDCVGWGLGADVDMLIDTCLAIHGADAEWFRPLVERVTCPVLVVHGDGDGSARCPPVPLSPSSAAAS